MVNVWDYVNAKKIKIIGIDQREYIGDVVCVMDSEENGRGEDDISIQINEKTIIGFLQREIAKIEVVQ